VAVELATADKIVAVGGPELHARLRVARSLAIGTLVGGGLAVATTVMAFTGHRKGAAVLGVATGVVGSILGALQFSAIYQRDLLERAVPQDILPQVQPGARGMLAGLPAQRSVFGTGSGWELMS
jgi:hypothetical protein